jgi:hypothetical protein
VGYGMKFLPGKNYLAANVLNVNPISANINRSMLALCNLKASNKSCYTYGL